MPETPVSSRLFVLTDEQANALVELGAALEPFVVTGSPADTATTAMDEQLAQQSRSVESLVGDVKDELEERFYDVPEGILPDLKPVAAAVVKRVLGVYSDAF